MPDDLTATLAAIRERAEAAADYTTGDWAEISARDVPLLLAAIEAVLGLADGWEATLRPFGSSWECAQALRDAITAALAGTARENASSSSAATREDGEP